MSENKMSLAEVAEESTMIADRMAQLGNELQSTLEQRKEPVETPNEELSEAFDEEVVTDSVQAIDNVQVRRVQIDEPVQTKVVEQPVPQPVKKVSEKVDAFDIDNIPVTNKKINIAKIEKKVHINSGFNVICGHSAYPASVKSLSLKIKNAMLNSSDNAYQFRNKICQAIYNSIETMGIQKPGFELWAKMTANVDLQTLMFGMFAATYPKPTKTSVTCQNSDCQKTIELKFSPTDIIQIKDSSIFDIISKINVTDITNEFIRTNSEVLRSTRVPFDDNSIIIEIYHASSVATLLNVLKSLSTTDLKEDADIIGTILSIKSVYVRDPDTRNYYKLDKPTDIYDFMVSDLMTPEISDEIDTQVNEYAKKHQIEYRVPQYVCPHCGHKHDGFPMDIEKTLFSKMQGVI